MKSQINEALKAIREKVGDHKPKVAIIFGRGLSSLAADIQSPITIPYADIPHFATSTVESHAGELVVGSLEGQTVVAMKGRFHLYEGYDMQQVTLPVRVMHAMGAEILIVSNAAGGMNPRFDLGDVCILEDHINLFPENTSCSVDTCGEY